MSQNPFKTVLPLSVTTRSVGQYLKAASNPLGGIGRTSERKGKKERAVVGIDEPKCFG